MALAGLLSPCQLLGFGSKLSTKSGLESKRCKSRLQVRGYTSYSLNSLKGGYIGDSIEEYQGGIQGDTRSSDKKRSPQALNPKP